MNFLDERLPLTFWNRCIPEPNSGCWLWFGAAIAKGYGRLSVAGRDTVAHRVSFEALIGPIPAGLVIDHLCRTPQCVNPAHMEPVTSAENTRRGEAGHWVRRAAALATHCARGHARTPENLKRVTRGFCCRICANLTIAQRREERVAAGLCQTAASHGQRIDDRFCAACRERALANWEKRRAALSAATEKEK